MTVEQISELASKEADTPSDLTQPELSLFLSLCGNYVLGNKSETLRRYNFRPYCENCGAKMDGE